MLNAVLIGSFKETQQSVAVILASLNVECEYVDDIEAALAYLRRSTHTIHVVLVDFDGMPEGLRSILAIEKALGVSIAVVGISKDTKCVSEDPRVIHNPVVEDDLRALIDTTFSEHSGLKTSSATTVQGARVLVVDDDEWIRNILCRNLEKAGYQPFAAIDGLQGIAEVERIEPDIILIDLNMPLLDGYQLAKELKASPRTKKIPIVAISGEGAEKDDVIEIKKG